MHAPTTYNPTHEASDQRVKRSCKLLSIEDEQRVEHAFRTMLPLGAHIDARLHGVLNDTLTHPGSLARAQLAYDILKDRVTDQQQALQLATAIEYFHTASLIFDDMPAMDNATERRGRPCPHVAYGEASAVLGALALINQGYALLWNSIGSLDAKSREEAARLVSACLGVHGILNGQARDLHFADSQRTMNDVLRVAEGKTVTLIRLTLLLPAIVAGCSPVTLNLLEELSTAWGLAYQIMDDLKDCLLSTEETGKSTSRDEGLGRPNFAIVAGLLEAMNRLSSLLATGRDALGHLPDDGAGWTSLCKLQLVLEAEAALLRGRITQAA